MAKKTKVADQAQELQLKDAQVGKSAMQIFMKKMLNRPQAMVGLGILLVIHNSPDWFWIFPNWIPSF